MKLTVLANESGEVIAAMALPRAAEAELADRSRGSRIVPREGQTVVTVDPPDELADRELDADSFEILRGYVVRDGALSKRD